MLDCVENSVECVRIILADDYLGNDLAEEDIGNDIGDEFVWVDLGYGDVSLFF